jgi:hypothetical protein
MSSNSPDLLTVFISTTLSLFVNVILIITKHIYDKKKEKEKIKLAIFKYHEENLDKMWINILPKTTEICYRIRNLSREIISLKQIKLNSIGKELEILYQELSEYIYKHIVILKYKNIYQSIHQYKHSVYLFISFLKKKNNNINELKNRFEQLNSIFNEIENVKL